jgi:hypothetical protein
VCALNADLDMACRGLRHAMERIWRCMGVFMFDGFLLKSIGEIVLALLNHWLRRYGMIYIFLSAGVISVVAFALWIAVEAGWRNGSDLFIEWPSCGYMTALFLGAVGISSLIVWMDPGDSPETPGKKCAKSSVDNNK